MNNLKRIVESEGAPSGSELWLNPKTGELKYFKNGEWKTASRDVLEKELGMQVVELTYEGALPQTGTLTQEQYDKLGEDNCLLVIKGRYYHKSFEGNSGGLDYLPIGIETYLNGVRRVYFTVGEDRGWTLAYKVFVEANSGTATAELEKLKVGNTTYKITHPAPQYGITVSGTISGNVFTPSNDTVTYADAVAAYLAGKNVILSIAADGYVAYSRVSYYLRESSSETQNMLVGYTGNGEGFGSVVWLNPDYQNNNPFE